MSIQSSGFTTTVQLFTNLPARTINVPSGNIGAGVLVGDLLLRFPLDDIWPCVHLAPYLFGGFGGILVGKGPSASFSETFTVTGPRGETVVVPNTNRQVTVNGRRLSRIRNNIGTDRVLGRWAVGSNIDLPQISGYSARSVTTSSTGLITTLCSLTLSA